MGDPFNMEKAMHRISCPEIYAAFSIDAIHDPT